MNTLRLSGKPPREAGGIIDLAHSLRQRFPGFMGQDTGNIGFGFADKGVPAEEPLSALSGSDVAILLEGCMGGLHGRVDVVGGVGRTAGPGDIGAGVCLLASHGYPLGQSTKHIPTTSKRSPCFD